MYVFGKHLKKGHGESEHEPKETQYRVKRLQLGSSEHFQLCSVDYLA